MSNFDNLCTVLVSSCDTYEDVWLLFFKALEIQWKDRPYKIVLNTESKAFEYKDMDIKTYQFYKPKQRVSWGKRLIKTLKAIDTKYVLLILDDFILTEKVDQVRLDQCIEWMEKDDNIAVFSFWWTPGNNIRDKKYPHFEKRPQFGEYRFNCQTAVWRRERLIEFLKPHESPWEWETIGSVRSSKYTDDFYSAIEDDPYIFTYDWRGIIHRGKWSKELAVPLAKEHDVEIDFSKRGFTTDSIPISKSFKGEVIRKWRKLRSLEFNIKTIMRHLKG